MMFLFKLILTFVSLSSFLLAAVSEAGLKPRSLPVKPESVEIAAEAPVYDIIIKFTDQSDVRLEDDHLRAAADVDLTVVDALLDRYLESGLQPLFGTIGTAELDQYKGELENITGRQLADLNSYYHVSLNNRVEAETLINRLNKLDMVEIAYYMPRPEPAGDILPVTPDYEANQTYREPEPYGLDFEYANGMTGGDGEGVRVVDIEGNWNMHHEDIDKALGGHIAGELINDLDWKNHGTAVMGIIAAGHNGYGISGGSPAADPGMISVGSMSAAEAIMIAAENLDPGDIILIELHAPGPHFDFQPRVDQMGYVCMEYFQAEFDAIQYAWAMGVVVVEAAGNGREDLDYEPFYGQLFDTTYRNSHAIMVGGGSADGYGREIMYFSNYGRRVNVQAYGEGVYTAGYGNLFDGDGDENQYYTSGFNGTSSASAIIASAAASFQGYYKSTTGTPATSDIMRDVFIATGSPQLGDTSCHIGPRPDLQAAFGSVVQPVLTVSPPVIDETLRQGADTLVSLWLYNGSSSQDIYYSILAVDSMYDGMSARVDWLTVSPSSGTVAASDSVPLDVSLDATGLHAAVDKFRGYLDIGWGYTPGSQDSNMVIQTLLKVICPGAVLCGDADEDNYVTPDDIDFIMNYLSGRGVSPECPLNADCDGREGITIADVVYLRDYLESSGPAPDCDGDSAYAYALSTLDTVFLPQVSNIPEDIESFSLNVMTSFNHDTRGFFFPVVTCADGSDDTFYFSGATCLYDGIDYSRDLPGGISLFYGHELSPAEFDDRRVLFTLDYERWRDGTGMVNTDISDFGADLPYAVERDGQLYRPVVVYQDLGSSFLVLSVYEMHFIGGPGSPPVEPIGVTVSSSDIPINWEAQASQPWIILDNYSGTTDQLVMVSADPEGLTPGYYEGKITFSIQDSSLQLARELQISLSVTTDTYNTRLVPEEYSTIQAAIDAAGYWDSILVGPGTYPEKIDYRGKPIKLVSRAGADSTFIADGDPNTSNWWTIYMREIHSPGAELKGFTVYGIPLSHPDADFWTRGGVWIENSDSVTIAENVFRNLFDTEPGHIVALWVHPVKNAHAAFVGNVMYDFRASTTISCDDRSTCNIIGNTFNNVRNVVAYGPPSGYEFMHNNVTTTIEDDLPGGCFAKTTDYFRTVGPDVTIERIEDGHASDYLVTPVPGEVTGAKEIFIDCNNFWNEFGPADLYGPNDISEDPLYCCPEGKVFYVQENSPCLPGTAPCGELIGALGYDSAECHCPLLTTPPYATYMAVYPEDIFGGINSPEPLFCWTFFDTLPGAVQQFYELEVGSDSDWTVAEMWCDGPISSADTCVVYGGTPLLDHTDYFFRLRVNNGTDWGGWREGRFRTHVSSTINIPGDYATIQEGVDVAFTGDTILVAPGTYNETVFFPENSIILKSSHGPDSTTIVGAGTYAAVAMDHGEVGRFSEVSGFTITGGRMGGVTGNFEFLRISNNIITGNNTDNYSSYYSGGAIYLSGIIDYVEITNNIIYGNINPTTGGASVRVMAPLERILIENNVLYDETADYGIAVDHSNDARIYNNTLYLSGKNGIAGLGSGTFDIRNNIVHSADEYAVWKDPGGYFPEFKVEYNCLFDVADSANFELPPVNIYDNPLLRDTLADDFRLMAASPCIDAGDPDTVFFDIDGTRGDMGAIPFINNLPLAAFIGFGPAAYREVVRDMVPQFNWLYIDTTENDQDMYHIQVGSDDNWDNVEIWDSGETISPDTSVTYSGPALDDHCRYFVRIRVHNGNQWGLWNESEFAISVSDFIQEAIDTASAGTTVIVPPGVYFESIDFKGKAISVVAAEGPRETFITADDLLYLVRFHSGENSQSTLEGFTLKGGWIGVLCENAGPTIRGNIFVGQKTIDWAAISLSGFGYPHFTTPGPSPAHIINNTILSCANGGISSMSTEIVEIKNNIIAYNEGYGIQSQEYTAHPDNSYNDVYYNFENARNFYGQCQKGTGSIESDPLLKADFSLHDNSPCIDAGHPDPVYNDPDGTRNDIGAVSLLDISGCPLAVGINYGEESEGSQVFTETPHIYWSYFDFPPSTQQGFHIIVDNESGFHEPTLWDTGEMMSSDTSILYAGQPLAKNNEYYLSIRVFNGTKWGETRCSEFKINIYNTELQSTIAAASPGDTVWAPEGTYAGPIDFMGKNIVLKSVAGPRKTTITAPDDENLVNFTNGESEQAVLEGFTLQGGWIGVLCINSSPTIRGNILIDQHVSDWSAICLAGPGYPPSASIGPAPARIINNTIVNSANGGISSFSSQTPVIHNNILIGCHSYGIHRQFYSAAMDADYNCLFEVGTPYVNSVNPGPGSLQVDPLLDSTYGLQAGSPCIDAGNPDSVYNDIDGTCNDIGAVPRLPAVPFAINLSYDDSLPPHCTDTVIPTITWNYWDTQSSVQTAYHIQVDDDTLWGIDDLWDSGETVAADSSAVYGGQELVWQNKYFLRIRLAGQSGWGDWITDYFVVSDTPLCADVNIDASVNILDITWLIDYLYKNGPPPLFPTTADVNRDGTVNILDITYLINYLYKGGPEPDCP